MEKMIFWSLIRNTSKKILDCVIHGLFATRGHDFE